MQTERGAEGLWCRTVVLLWRAPGEITLLPALSKEDQKGASPIRRVFSAQVRASASSRERGPLLGPHYTLWEEGGPPCSVSLSPWV